MNRLSIIAGVLLVGYPFAVYFGLSRWEFSSMATVLLVLFVLRALSSRIGGINGPLAHIAQLTGIIGFTLVLLGYVFEKSAWLLFYPVAVNAVMLAVFSHSLTQPQSIIERVARLKHPNLPESAVRYTKKVTQIWCVFFSLNGLIALATCAMPLASWTLYNGFISYVAGGSLFAIEYLVRTKVQTS